MPNMLGGDIVRLRINPKDSMRICDALAKMGVDVASYSGTLSFSHATKMVLESCLAALERDGLIPTRDGFEYSEMMSAFPKRAEAKQSRHKQITFTRMEHHPSRVAQPIVPEDPEARRFRIRFEELSTKYNAAPESMDEAEITELQTMLDKKASV